MERLVRNAIVDHMTENNLFSTSQHGFISGKSCITQLLEFMEDITESIDNGKDVDIVYLDFSKAFDKVAHRRLIKKLENYGITGTLLNWIQDFLSNRKQRVVIKGESSDWTDVTSGIPQGSVLGPILFLVYINDLPGAIKGLMKIFADDAKVYYEIESIDTPQLMQDDLNRADLWAILWDMLFNNKKCHHMHVGENSAVSTYKMGSGENRTEIQKVKAEKDLGVTIDDKLKFRDHITQKVNIANRNLGIIFRTFSYMDKEMFLNLYKTLVRPHLEYATQIWSPIYKKDKVILENVQRRATRLIKCVQNKSYQERLTFLGLPTLEYRRERADMVQVFKIMHDIDKVDKGKLFQMSECNTTRGHSLKLFKKRSRLNVRANYFTQQVVDQWNSLPECVVTAPSLNAFKSRLNKLWKDHPFKFNPACYLTNDYNTRLGKQRRNAPIEALVA